MTMKQCPSCRANLATEAMACQFCGFSYVAQHAAAAAAVARQQMNKNLVACRACRIGIAKGARTCVNCGAIQRHGAPIKSILVLGVVGVIAVGAAGASQKKEQERAEVTTAAPIDVGASELQADYDANEVAADDKYKGAVLRITGTVESINKDIVDDAYVVLHTGDFKGVQCHFNSARGLQTLRKGTQVVIRCRGDGYIINSPVARDCVLE